MALAKSRPLMWVGDLVHTSHGKIIPVLNWAPGHEGTLVADIEHHAFLNTVRHWMESSAYIHALVDFLLREEILVYID